MQDYPSSARSESFLCGIKSACADDCCCMRDDFHHLRWVNDICNEYVPFNYVSMRSPLSAPLHGQSESLLPHSLFTHIILTSQPIMLRRSGSKASAGYVLLWCLRKISFISLKHKNRFFSLSLSRWIYQRPKVITWVEKNCKHCLIDQDVNEKAQSQLKLDLFISEHQLRLQLNLWHFCEFLENLLWRLKCNN